MTIIVVPDQLVGDVDEAYVHPPAYEQTDSANETVGAQETLNEARSDHKTRQQRGARAPRELIGGQRNPEAYFFGNPATHIPEPVAGFVAFTLRSQCPAFFAKTNW